MFIVLHHFNRRRLHSNKYLILSVSKGGEAAEKLDYQFYHHANF